MQQWVELQVFHPVSSLGHNADYGHNSALGRLPSLLEGRVVGYLADHPGSSGRAVGRGLGIRHDSQIWAVLDRLRRGGVLAKEPNGIASAWTVTAQGHDLLRGLPEGIYG